MTNKTYNYCTSSVSLSSPSKPMQRQKEPPTQKTHNKGQDKTREKSGGQGRTSYKAICTKRKNQRSYHYLLPPPVD